MQISLGELRKLIITNVINENDSDVPLVDQTPGYCGPASLKAVLMHFGVNKSEKEIARIVGATRKAGSTAEQLVSAAKKLEFDAKIFDDVDFDFIRELLDDDVSVIIDWWSETDGHYSVVTKVTNDKLTIMDPEEKRHRTFGREEFLGLWFDFETKGTGVPAQSNLVIRRIIAVSPTKLRNYADDT